jgi:hypothetical protein
MHRPALALALLLACGDGPPERKLPAPPGASEKSTPAAPTPATPLPPPDTPAARDLLAICESAAALPPGLPAVERLRRALTTVESTVSSDSLPLVQRLRARDLAEAAADLRQAATAAEVHACSLADAMDAVSTAAPNTTDALSLLQVLEALETVSPEYKDRILAAGCSEMPACGRECSAGLAATAEAEPTQRVFALMRECAAFRAQAPQGAAAGEAAAFAWIRARVAVFADASAEHLPPEAAARLAALRKTLQL